ncbi:DUF2306 domain-containing protein [Neobacillus sp. MM2021_6]|uniref:DUF2306 domain-containing protein n=1 Tax=Bacillaceae TaxID=186817 RepID=UPI001408EB19|nr:MULTISPECIES: DUF2306 domain-containing protein [Bacillaceae]MBO0962786.1 DUF2306 domain-containing protein [Neobacillus sp. MM2021_6]NHC19223.1 DUF2306 domain-containing protein [Bacillus sp. MM2020_4]
MINDKNRKFTIRLMYSIIGVFTIYIFIMFLLNGVEHAPMVKGKMADHDFSVTRWKWFFYPHILLGTISLAIGPFQLTRKSQQNPRLHKMLGKIYAVAIFINILMVPYLSFWATGGNGTMIAFLVLNVFWLWTTSMGVIRATQRKIKAHMEWILRSYAITWVFVTFRIVVIPFSLFLDSSFAFPIAVYLGMAINLLFVEWRNWRNKKYTKVHVRTVPKSIVE